METGQQANTGSRVIDQVLVIIPVRNEATTLVGVIQALQSQGLTKIRVVDNGSTDGSAYQAKAAGAEVVCEPVPGYGRACWRGLQNLPPGIEWILFCDGDGSDDLAQLPQFWAVAPSVDLIIGNRRATLAGRQALTPAQNFGNRLASFLIRWGWGHQYHDLGPLRLVRRRALEQLQMRDRGFGWTVEMQVKAVEACLRICELPVGYRSRQGGYSKISGTLSGSFQAGTIILSTLMKLYLRRWQFSIAEWGSALFLLFGALLTFPHGDFHTGSVPQFWLGIGVMSVGFILSWRLETLDGARFWAITLLTRLVLLPMFPGSDVWRYLWEGYIQNFGFSPYHFAPDAPELVPLRPEWWGMINHLNVSAIYPPIAQLGFRGLAVIAPSVLLYKLAFILADVLVCWLLSRRFGYLKTTLYAWNPLIIYSFAGGAHYDSWFLLPLVAAGLLFDFGCQGRWVGSALLLGISVAVKWMSLPILSFLVWQAYRKESWQQTAGVVICGLLPLIVSAMPFCRFGACPLIPTDSVFVSYGRSAELLPYLVSLVWEESRRANWYYLLPLALTGLFLLSRANNFQQFVQGYFLALLTISPIIHAWYFTWLVPFAVATQNWGVRFVSLSAFVYFLLPHRMAMGSDYLLLTGLERGLLWLPLLLGWLWTLRSQQQKLSTPQTVSH
ncbi:MAG: glycosyltransferase family 2 protein [Cyanophyceae cyanobacterium]